MPSVMRPRWMRSAKNFCASAAIITTEPSTTSVKHTANHGLSAVG